MLTAAAPSSCAAICCATDLSVDQFKKKGLLASQRKAGTVAGEGHAYLKSPMSVLARGANADGAQVVDGHDVRSPRSSSR